MVEVASGSCFHMDRPLTGEDDGRRPMRRFLAQRAERDATRGQRCAEVECQLRESLGIDSLEAAVLAASDGSSSSRPSPRAPSSPRGLKESRERRRVAVEKEILGRMGVPVPGPDGSDCRPSAAEKTNWRGVPLKRPALPPKPKPHRPLNVAEAPAPEPSQPQQRWKSALRPVWPDRQKPEGELMSRDRDVLACIASPKPESPRQELRAVADLASPSPRADGCARAIPLTLTTCDADSVPAAALDLASLQSPHRVPSAKLSATRPQSPARSLLDGPAPALRSSTVSQEVMPSSSSNADPRSEPGLNRTLDPYELACSLASEEKKVAERAAQLALSAKKLRENAQRVRLENRRGRLFGGAGSSAVDGGSEESAPEPPIEVSIPDSKRVLELRKKIAELDELNALERERLEQEQQAAEARRRDQEAFERDVQERTERDLRLHRERQAREAAERAQKANEMQKEREERDRRRQEQLAQEKQHSMLLETQRREARSDASQMKWHTLEEELDRQWAEQEAEERRRLEEYAALRRKQYQEWDRQLHSERQRFASAAEFRDAAFLHQARSAASADETFYSQQRAQASASGPSGPSGAPQPETRPQAPAPEAKADANLSPEEKQVLRELQSMVGAPREQQKAKVKELLRRWHPDKNPHCSEKATKVFQFVQKQRETVLGL